MHLRKREAGNSFPGTGEKRLEQRLSGKCWRLQSGWGVVAGPLTAGRPELTGTLGGGG